MRHLVLEPTVLTASSIQSSLNHFSCTSVLFKHLRCIWWKQQKFKLNPSLQTCNHYTIWKPKGHNTNELPLFSSYFWFISSYCSPAASGCPLIPHLSTPRLYPFCSCSSQLALIPQHWLFQTLTLSTTFLTKDFTNKWETFPPPHLPSPTHKTVILLSSASGDLWSAK